jgi:hypothetical protein
MKSMPQLDIHPDAESLNAFVERVLPEREREEILVHLGVCGRCREVVYLAQEAALDVQAAPAIAARSAARKTSWFGSGWLVWAPAAVLAGIVALGVFVHFRHAAAGPEVAVIAPQNGQGLAVPTTQEPADKGTAPASAATVKRPAAAAHPALFRAPSGARSAEAVPAAGVPVENAAVAEANSGSAIAAPSPAAAGQEFQAQEAKVQIPSEAAGFAVRRKQAGGAPSNSLATVKTEQAEIKAAANRALAAQSAGLSASARNGAMPASSASFDGGGSPNASGMIAFEAGSRIALPGGRKAVSFATAQRRTLALDQGGALFLSLDAGSHWEAVVRQWTGRAVAVHATAESSASGAAFEIVNDSNRVWVSVDGRTWTAQ